MRQAIRRAAARRVVIAEHRSGFGGQCRLASAAVSLPGLRVMSAEYPAFNAEIVAKWYKDACQARTKLRREIRART
ncbi:hypothetical protein [Streptomyces malaysiensis]|uniref:hypothetical protein n=1 Tax=Streptomyces malaysiensis TaxID=92644 RepID=UPI001AD8C254|nr:hypothetical protein [Streptomyces malaysiensis]